MSATRAPTLRKLPGTDDLGCDFAKEAFHQIEPGGRGGDEMEVKTGMALEPGGDFGVLVGRIVVANSVKLQLGGDFLVDLAQEGEPLLVAMARGGVGKHLAGKVVQGGKEGHRSVPVVVMGPGANVSLAQRQSGLGCVREPDTGSFHRCRAPRPARADPDRGPPRPRIFPQTEGLWRA